MKKYLILLLMFSFISICTTACGIQNRPKQNMIQSTRRFAKYLEPQEQQSNPNAIDLSEGPRQNYNAKFGPKNIDFDIKIVDPYNKF